MKKSRLLGIAILICATFSIILSMLFVLFRDEIVLPNSFIDSTTFNILAAIIAAMFGVLFAAYSTLLIKRISPKEKIYISYATSDKEISLKFSDELELLLLDNPLHRYKILTADDVSFGDDISKSIDKFISASNYIIVLLSPEYMQSPLAMNELSKAELSGAPLIPVLLTPPSMIKPFPQRFIGLRALELYDLSSAEFEKQISRLAKDISHRHIA